MNEDLAVDLGRRALEIALMVSAPVLITSLVVGLSISIFQAVTMINEITLTFVPKILAVFLSLVVFLPWILEILIGFTKNLYLNIPWYIQ